MCALSSSPAASAFWGSAISAPMGWVSRSESWRSIPHAPACRRNITLPVLMDCGTNNESLLRDPLYLGLRQTRPAIAELDEFVEEFVTAVQRISRMLHPVRGLGGRRRGPPARALSRPGLLLQRRHPGHGGGCTSRNLGALRITGGKLSEQTFLFLGAGSAGIGIADLLAQAMTLEGLTPKQARARIWLFDVNGLIESTREELADFQTPYAHTHAPTNDFVAAIESINPTAIIGVSTVAKAFNQRVIETMARINQRPIIFPYSNPTSHSECTAEEAYRWSRGPRDLRQRQPVSARANWRPDLRARSGQQRLHLSGYRPGRLCDPSPPRH